MFYCRYAATSLFLVLTQFIKTATPISSHFTTALGITLITYVDVFFTVNFIYQLE